jgi:hypothetical protein
MSWKKNRRQGSSMGVMLLILGGLFVVGALALALPGRGGPTVVDESRIEVRGQPSLRADPQAIDFGVVPLDTPKTFSFALTNVGDETLRISQDPYIEILEGC